MWNCVSSDFMLLAVPAVCLRPLNASDPGATDLVWCSRMGLEEGRVPGDAIYRSSVRGRCRTIPRSADDEHDDGHGG